MPLMENSPKMPHTMQIYQYIHPKAYFIELSEIVERTYF